MRRVTSDSVRDMGVAKFIRVRRVNSLLGEFPFLNNFLMFRNQSLVNFNAVYRSKY